MADARTVGRDGGDGPVDSCGVCGGYGVPHLIFELRMSRRQRDGCGSDADITSGSEFGSGRPRAPVESKPARRLLRFKGEVGLVHLLGVSVVGGSRLW